MRRVSLFSSIVASARRSGFPSLASLLEWLARFLAVPALLSLFLSACATEGDFGRPRPTIFDRVADELIASEATLLASRGGSGATDDEIAMRESGHRLASPLGLPAVIPPVPGGPALPPPGGRPGCCGHATPPPPPLASIMRELDIDHHSLTQFGQATRRVLLTDSRRMMAVREDDPYLLDADRAEARARMRDNFDFIESVFRDFGRRLRAYHYALDDIRARAPGVPLVAPESSLQHLHDRAAALEYELNHFFQAAVARGEYLPPRFATHAYPPAAPVPAGYGPPHSGGGAPPRGWGVRSFK